MFVLEAGGSWLPVSESVNLVQIDNVLVFVEAFYLFILEKSCLNEGTFF